MPVSRVTTELQKLKAGINQFNLAHELDLLTSRKSVGEEGNFICTGYDEKVSSGLVARILPWECDLPVSGPFLPAALYCFRQNRSRPIVRGTFLRINTKRLLYLFQNSLLREVENAKKQLEAMQHDKVRQSLGCLEICQELN